MDDKLLGMPRYSFVEVGGPIRSGFLFLLHLAWESRFRLPVLLIVGLMVLDVRMQLEIDFDAELVQDRRQQHNGIVAGEGDNDDEGDDDSDEEDFEIDDDNDIDDDDLETIEDEDLSSMSDSYESFYCEFYLGSTGQEYIMLGVLYSMLGPKIWSPGLALCNEYAPPGPERLLFFASNLDLTSSSSSNGSLVRFCKYLMQENETTWLIVGSQIKTACMRKTMRLPLALSLQAPNLWAGFVFLAVVTGALIPEGMLLEEPIVESPPDPPRQLQASSTNRHDGHLISSMEVDEDQSIGEEEGSKCYMEIQVTRRIPGRCVSLGRLRGCVAGVYLHPLHHDCL